MAWPTPSFAALATSPPSQQLGIIDAMFAQVAVMVALPCTASGANAILLTPAAGAPIPPSYVTGASFIFRAPQTTTAAVTIQVSALAALPLYHQDGTTQVTTILSTGNAYVVTFDQAVNGGAGGFLLLGYPAGTSGQLLKWQVSGYPKWAGGGSAGGTLVALNTLTASASASLSDTTSLTSTYSTYILTLNNLVVATAAAQLQLTVHTGGAFSATGYDSNVFGYKDTTQVAGNQITTFIPLSSTDTANTVAGAISGFLIVSGVSGTANPKCWTGMVSYSNSTPATAAYICTGHQGSVNTAVDGFKIAASAGNLTSGTVQVYGIT